MSRSVHAGIALAALGAAAFAASPGTDDGVRLFEARRLPEARAALETAAREDSRDARAAYYLGRTLLEQGDPGKAAEWLEKAIALEPARAEMHQWLGRAWGELALTVNVFKQASLAPRIRREFERSVVLDPENVEARLDLLEFFIQAPGLMGGSLEKARAQAAEIARRDRMRGYRASARIAEHEKRFETARAEYERAGREFPDRIEPAIWSENLWIARKDYGQAFEAIDAFLTRNPSSLAGRYQVGRLAALSGKRLEEGAQCLTQYLAHEPKPDEPGLAWAHVRLGQIHEKRGNRTEARHEFEAALALDGKLKEAKEALKRVS